MLETLASALVTVIGLYLLVGILFAVVFVWRGLGRIDPAAREGTWGFRVLVFPGAMALWPLLLGRWWRRSPPPGERNAHRDLAPSRPRAGGDS